MRNIFVATLFMLATLAWAAAQQPAAVPEGSGGQATSPSAQNPGATQSQPSIPGSTGQQTGEQPEQGVQPGAQGQMSHTAVTQGCLGGSNPNYTITDQAGTTYKLNIPAGADASVLSSHIGEPVAVMGEVNNSGSAKSSAKSPSIDVAKIGRGSIKCPASGSTGAQNPPSH